MGRKNHRMLPVSSQLDTATQCVSRLYLEKWLYRRANFFENDRTICSEYRAEGAYPLLA